MPSPLSVQKNNYLKNPKNSSIETPSWLAEYICQLVEYYFEYDDDLWVYDPAAGRGNLLLPFKQHGWSVRGSDIGENCPVTNNYFQSRFEDIEEFSGPANVIVCNPPFNSAPGRKLYPEVFLRQIHKLFGNEIPVVMIAPMGLLLNQRLKSARWRYLRDNWELSSILSLSIDTFKKDDGSPVLFHAEVLFFNFLGLKPHYFLPESILP